MMQLTEEQRKALTEWIEEGLLCAEEFGFKGNVRKCMEIALAALTAEPVAMVVGKLGAGLKATCYEGALRPAEGSKLYTTPPVAALRLPDAKPSWDDEEGNDIDYMEPRDIYAMGKDDGYNRCIHDVKRLNAAAPEEKQND